MAIDLDDPHVREVFFDIYEGLPRGGPGNTESTLRALATLGPLPAKPQIIDIGCGPGKQTLVLAEAVADAEIIALDFHRPFLDTLDAALEERAIGPRVQTRLGDMAQLDFPAESFDLVWSEGAAYQMGVEAALEAWKGMLKPGGAVALTEATWFRTDPPEVLRRFWADEYPAMADVDSCLDLFKRCGYQLVGHFALPEQAWWDDFYTPMEARLDLLGRRYSGDPLAQEVLTQAREEIEICRQYSAFFGYTFFVAKCNDASALT